MYDLNDSIQLCGYPILAWKSSSLPGFTINTIISIKLIITYKTLWMDLLFFRQTKKKSQRYLVLGSEYILSKWIVVYHYYDSIRFFSDPFSFITSSLDFVFVFVCRNIDLIRKKNKKFYLYDGFYLNNNNDDTQTEEKDETEK